MDKLTMNDMNSLNAIAGYLNVIGEFKAAAVLIEIQRKATLMLESEEPSSNYERGKVYKDGKCH